MTCLSFGVVYLGTWRGSPVAIKEVKQYSTADLESFRSEAQLMKSLRVHMYVVCLFCDVVRLSYFMHKHNIALQTKQQSLTYVSHTQHT